VFFYMTIFFYIQNIFWLIITHLYYLDTLLVVNGVLGLFLAFFKCIVYLNTFEPCLVVNGVLGLFLAFLFLV
jgi:hypothetical protein